MPNIGIVSNGLVDLIIPYIPHLFALESDHHADLLTFAHIFDLPVPSNHNDPSTLGTQLHPSDSPHP